MALNRLGAIVSKSKGGSASGYLADTSGRAPLGSTAQTAYPLWVWLGADVDMDFKAGRYWGSDQANLAVTRSTTNATDLLPASASGAAYSTFGASVARYTVGSGILIEEARTNNLLNSTAPVTQTTASLATGTYILWVNGSGSALASGATATITGAASATNGAPNTFVVTVLGTVTITVTGSLNAFQVELGSFGTSLIVTAGAAGTRNADVVTLRASPFLVWTSVSMYASISIPQTNSGVQYRVVTVSNAAASDELQIRNNGSAAWLASDTAGTSVSASPAFSTGQNRIAMAVTASDAAIVYNGGTVATSGTGVLPTGTPLLVTLGGSALTAARIINGYLERVSFWVNSRVSNVNLQNFTKS